jgi:hypothetical protein
LYIAELKAQPEIIRLLEEAGAIKWLSGQTFIDEDK